MRTACVIAFLSCAAAHAGEEAREIAAAFPPDTVDCVVMKRGDAARAEEDLRGVFARLRVSPRCTVAVHPLPGERTPRLVCVRGREADVALVKKVLAALDEAAGVPGAAPPVVRIEPKAVEAAEMKRRILAAAAGAGMPLGEADLMVHPGGGGGSLFFIGPADLSARVVELGRGLDRPDDPSRGEAARAYARQVALETVKAFGTLLSTVLSAAVLLLLHAVLCRLPGLGMRYRRSFRLFWEKLFAAFRGKDLAWEIITTAAGLGVAATGGAEKGPRAAAGEAPFGPEEERRARAVAEEYLRFRGMDPDEAGVRAILAAAVAAAAAGRGGEAA
ncbi:MAG: hypothetical protein PHN82_00745 [bacterium]|nr:hypothetical protein [bacterium]